MEHPLTGHPLAWRRTDDPEYHFALHGGKGDIEVASASEYEASALETISNGIPFAYEQGVNQDPEAGYFIPSNGLFTALSDDESELLTHFRTDERYIRTRPMSTYGP